MATISAFAPPKTRFQRLSSVFLVDSIELCLDFWVDRLGFEVRLQVNGDVGLDFVILGRDDVEIMYRTRSSLAEGTPGVADSDDHQPWVVLYLQVGNLDELLPRLEGVEVVSPYRETFVGHHEIYVREPSGRILALTSHA